MEILRVNGVTKTFAGRNRETITALSDVSLYVDKGEFVSMIGPSGSGKSTLLDLIAGLSVPDDGEILLAGNSIIGQKGLTSYMPQKDVLFPWRTILDNVIVPLEVNGSRKSQARKQAEQLLPKFGLEKFADSYPDMLSGGMKQRASFLRTYLCQKELMLLDEPFGKLDALTRMEMQAWLLQIWQTAQSSVLMVTHDIDEAILLSDRIYVLSPRPGEILGEVKVPLPRPRESRITLQPEFTSLKRELLDLLSSSIEP